MPYATNILCINLRQQTHINTMPGRKELWVRPYRPLRVRARKERPNATNAPSTVDCVFICFVCFVCSASLPLSAAGVQTMQTRPPDGRVARHVIGRSLGPRSHRASPIELSVLESCLCRRMRQLNAYFPAVIARPPHIITPSPVSCATKARWITGSSRDMGEKAAGILLPWPRLV